MGVAATVASSQDRPSPALFTAHVPAVVVVLPLDYSDHYSIDSPQLYVSERDGIAGL